MIPGFDLESVQFQTAAESGASGGTNIFGAPAGQVWHQGLGRKDWLWGNAGVTFGQGSQFNTPVIVLGVAAVVALALIVRRRK